MFEITYVIKRGLKVVFASPEPEARGGAISLLSQAVSVICWIRWKMKKEIASSARYSGPPRNDEKVLLVWGKPRKLK